MIRTHVLSVLKSSTSQVNHLIMLKHLCIYYSINVYKVYFFLFFCLVGQVQTALRGSGGSKTAVSEGVEASIIYVRFKAAASEVISYFLFDPF